MFQQFVVPPSRLTHQDALAYFELHQMAQDFRLELSHRDAFELYCHWYYETAQQIRADYGKMQSEVQLRAWFSGQRLD